MITYLTLVFLPFYLTPANRRKDASSPPVPVSGSSRFSAVFHSWVHPGGNKRHFSGALSEEDGWS
ncbi:hypothetical protein GCM10008922_15190 [Faecalicatena contorta]